MFALSLPQFNTRPKTPAPRRPYAFANAEMTCRCRDTTAPPRAGTCPLNRTFRSDTVLLRREPGDHCAYGHRVLERLLASYAGGKAPYSVNAGCASTARPSGARNTACPKH